MKIGILICFIFTYLIGICQEKNILDCMELIGFKLQEYNHSDSYPTDTIIDIKRGYYELYIKNSHTIDDIEYNTSVCQVVKFNNSDKTTTIGITGYYSDMQCSSHSSRFYEISKTGKEFVLIENSHILPALSWMAFLDESEAINALNKYLPAIKENYLDSTATIEDVLNEIYDIHYILPRKGSIIKATLNVCDYIPVNEVNINKNDWNIITSDIKTISLDYNKDQKRFEIINFTESP